MVRCDVCGEVVATPSTPGDPLDFLCRSCERVEAENYEWDEI